MGLQEETGLVLAFPCTGYCHVDYETCAVGTKFGYAAQFAQKLFCGIGVWSAI